MTVSHLSRSRNQLWSDLLGELGGTGSALTLSESELLAAIRNDYGGTVSHLSLSRGQLLASIVSAAGGSGNHLLHSDHELVAKLVTALGGSGSSSSSSFNELLAGAVNAAAEGEGGGGGGDPAIDVTGAFTPPAWSFISPDSGNAAVFAVAPTGNWLNGDISDQDADYSGATSLSSANVSAIVGSIDFVSSSAVLMESMAFPGLKIISGDTGIADFASPPVLTSIDLGDLIETLGDLYLEGEATTTFDLSSLVTVGGALGLYTDEAVALGAPLLETVAGSVSINSAGHASVSLPSLLTIGGNLTLTGDTAVSLDLLSLTTVGGVLTLGGESVTSIDISSLSSVGELSFFCSSLVSIDFSALQTIVQSFDPNSCPLMTSMNLSALTSIGGDFLPNNGLDTLTSILLPAIVTMGGRIEISDALGGIPSLTTFTIGASLTSLAGNVIMDSCALNQASVDNILVRLAALDGTSGTTTYDGKTVTITGTSSPPGATGLTAKTTLEGRGNTVTVNS